MITPEPPDIDASLNLPNERAESRHCGSYFTFPPCALAATTAGAKAEPFHRDYVESV